MKFYFYFIGMLLFEMIWTIIFSIILIVMSIFSKKAAIKNYSDWKKLEFVSVKEAFKESREEKEK